MIDIDVSKLKKIGKNGGNVDVYELNDEQVLKIKKSDSSHYKSAQILKSIQGLPFVPKLYDYGDDWLIMQRIHGTTLNWYENKLSWFALPYDYETHKENAKKFIKGCYDLKYQIEDIRSVNVMFDTSGQFWIVDVGGFTKIKHPKYDVKSLQLLLKHGKSIVDNYESIKKRIEVYGEEYFRQVCNLYDEDDPWRKASELNSYVEINLRR